MKKLYMPRIIERKETNNLKEKGLRKVKFERHCVHERKTYDCGARSQKKRHFNLSKLKCILI
uniref:Uncharacterized protein n=1 Tax=Anopheles dirus TaxID=7168 RepID=A0A182NW02_9DIPT